MPDGISIKDTIIGKRYRYHDRRGDDVYMRTTDGYFVNITTGKLWDDSNFCTSVFYEVTEDRKGG